jgi:hypothetical protein
MYVTQNIKLDWAIHTQRINKSHKNGFVKSHRQLEPKSISPFLRHVLTHCYDRFGLNDRGVLTRNLGEVDRFIGN